MTLLKLEIMELVELPGLGGDGAAEGCAQQQQHDTTRKQTETYLNGEQWHDRVTDARVELVYWIGEISWYEQLILTARRGRGDMSDVRERSGSWKLTECNMVSLQIFFLAELCYSSVCLDTMSEVHTRPFKRSLSIVHHCLFTWNGSLTSLRHPIVWF